MQAAAADRITHNAFRVLGLCATASQACIDQSARKMRIWSDPRRIPPTPWDLNWLGPLSRSKNDVEQAVALLSDPVTRVGERLFWFHREAPPLEDDLKRASEV